ncbi:MAG: hypothetical protein ACFE7R_05815 [Candidatus Hodarchaeota archaeon]
MQLPGTNIEVLISSNIIEIRDEDFLKSIEYTGRRYEDVLDEIQRVMYKRGWDVTCRVIKYVLGRLGLPDVDYFPDAELTEDEAADMKQMLDSLRELTDTFLSPTSGKAVDEAKEEGKDNLTFSFYAENIPKDAPEKKKSRESSFDWEEAPSIGSSSDGVSS